MNKAHVSLVTLWFAAVVLLSGNSGSSVAQERRPSAKFVGGVHGSMGLKGKSRGAVQDRPVGRPFSKPSLQYLWSGGHNPTVIGGPYRPNRNVAVWGQPLNGARSAAAVSGTVRNRGRY